MLVGVAQRLGEHRLGERLDLLGHHHALVPGELERQLLVVAPQPSQLLAQGRAGVEAGRRQRLGEGVAQVVQRALHLVGAALTDLLAERTLGAQHQRHAEQALHHALVDFAGEVDAGLEQARATLLARGDPHAGRERGGLAERPHRVALGLRELEAGAAAVGEDHPQPAPARGDRRAGEVLDAGHVRVARGHPALEVAGGLHHAVLRQRHLRDRGLLERAVDAAQQIRPRSRGCPRHHELARLVVEQQAGALHARHVAQRHAEPVVEAGAAGAGVAVELAQQLDDHVERVRARRGRHVECSTRYAGERDRRRACSEVSDTVRT